MSTVIEHPAAKLTPELIQQIADDYKDDFTVPQLAEKYDLAKATIIKALKLAGITPERKDKLFRKKIMDPEIQDQLIKDFTTKGTYPTELAEQYNLNKADVLDTLRLAHVADQHPIMSQPDSRRKISDEVIDSFCKDFQEECTTIYELSRRYNVHPYAVSYWLRKRGLLGGTATTLPKMSDFRILIRDHGMEITQVLLDIVFNDCEETRNRIDAAKLCLEHGFGRPRDVIGPDKNQSQNDAGKRIMGITSATVLKNLLTPTPDQGSVDKK